jgi:tetratricopeptide (TPR) repeat protein
MDLFWGTDEGKIDMGRNKEFLHDDQEYFNILNRYNQLSENGNKGFFDVHEFEMLIEHFLQEGDFVNAEIVSDLAVNQHPTSLNIQLRKAQLLIDKGEYSLAFEILDFIESIDNTNYELYLLKGIALNYKGSRTESKNCFERAIQISSENRIDALFSIAVNYENLNDYKTAITYLEMAYKEDSKNINVLFELGFCFDHQLEYDESLNYYNQYLDINPFTALVWFNIGVIYSKTSQFEKALEAYDYVLAIEDKYELAYYNKGNALANSGKYELAIEAYKEYLKYEPKSTDTLCFLGECYERLEDLGNAFGYYKKTLEIEPNFPDAIYGIGIVYSMQENFFESIKYINRAIEINPSNSDYWFSLGNIYIKLKLNDKAIESFCHSVDLDPSDYESWLNLSELYFRRNLLSKAIKTLEEAYLHNSGIALINYRLAAFHILRNNISEGMVYFRRGIKISFDDHEDVFKYCPQASEIKEINELLKQINSLKQ